VLRAEAWASWECGRRWWWCGCGGALVSGAVERGPSRELRRWVGWEGQRVESCNLGQRWDLDGNVYVRFLESERDIFMLTR
jgi:hypothetical protein